MQPKRTASPWLSGRLASKPRPPVGFEDGDPGSGRGWRCPASPRIWNIRLLREARLARKKIDFPDRITDTGARRDRRRARRDFRFGAMH